MAKPKNHLEACSRVYPEISTDVEIEREREVEVLKVINEIYSNFDQRDQILIKKFYSSTFSLFSSSSSSSPPPRFSLLLSISAHSSFHQ